MKLDAYFTSYTKIKSKWFTNSNIGAKTIKYSGKTKGTNPHDFKYDNGFLDLITKHKQQTKNRQIRLHQN